MALTNLSQITTSGISTLADINLNNLTGVAATFTGNVTVGGVLTYDDVTNVDSVGLITARSGVSITGGDLTLPDAIVHAGDTNTRIRFPAADTITAETGGSERLRITSTGRVGIGTVPNTNATLDIKGAGASVIRLNSNNFNSYTDLRHNQSGKYLEITPSSTSNQSFIVNKPNGDEALRVTSDGESLIGATSARVVEYSPGTAGTPKLQVEGNAGASSQILITDTRTDGRNSQLAFAKTRDGSIVQDNDILGSIGFFGDDGSDLRTWGGRITCEVDGTPGGNDMPGRLAFFTTADGASLPTERLRITSAGNVGIGLTNPFGQLQVRAGTNANFSFTTGGGESSLEILNDAGSANVPLNVRASVYKIKIQGNEKVSIDSSGNVGINTSAPNTKLQIVTTSGARAITLTAPTLGPYMVFETDGTAFADIGSLSGLIGSGSDTDTLALNARGSRDLAFRTNNNVRLSITSAGKVGINSTAPATAFDVVGQGHFKNNGSSIKIESVPGTNFTQIQLTNTGGNFYVGRENNAGNWFGTGSNYASVLRSDGAYPVIFRVNGANRLEISSAGKVGINKSSPSSFLHVTGSDYQTLRLENTDNGANGSYIELYNNSDSPADNDYTGIISFKNNNSADEEITYSQIRGQSTDVTDGTEDGILTFHTRGAGAFGERLRVDSAGRLGLNQTSINATRMMEITQPSSYTSALRIHTAGSAGNPGYIEWFTGISNWKLGVDNNSDSLIVRRDGTKLVRIDSAGSVHIENDIGKFTTGTSADLQIYHDGSNSYINDSGTGGLYIRGGGTIGFRDSENSMANLANFNSGGSIDLYYNGTKKFETNGSGIKVAGRVFLGGSTNGGLDYNSTADTLEFLTTNGGTHSELTSGAYVPSTNAGKDLGHHTKRWDSIYCTGVAFGGSTDTDQHLLDDYEEGSWTPTIGGGSGTSARSYYIKVGRKVTICCNISLSSALGSVFTVTLPFGGVTTGYTGSSQGVEAHGVCMLYNPVPPSNTIDGTVYCWGATASIYWTIANGGWVAATGAQVGSSIQFTATYISN